MEPELKPTEPGFPSSGRGPGFLELEEALSCVFWAVAGFFQQGLVSGWLRSMNGVPVWLGLVVGQVVFQTFVIASYLRVHRGRARDLATNLCGADRAPGKQFGIGILAGLAFLPAAYGLQALTSLFFQSLGIEVPVQNSVEILRQAGVSGRFWLYLTAGVGAPIAEEILFRGVLFRAIRDRGFPMLALIGTAVVFGGIHFNLGALVPLSAFGLLLALLTDRTGGLVAPIAAHMTFNAAPFLFLLLGVEFGK